MVQAQEIFLDWLIDAYADKARTERQKAKLSATPRRHEDLNGFREWQESTETIEGILSVLQQSSLIPINGAIANDFYSRTQHDASDYLSLIKLSFPVIFFELVDPLLIRVDTNLEKRIRGMLFSTVRKGNIQPKLFDSAGFPEDFFHIMLFYDRTNSQEPDFDAVYFKVSLLPEFDFISGDGLYRYVPGEGVLDLLQRKIEGRRSVQNPEFVKQNLERILNLCVNLVEYVTVNNVYLEEVPRESRPIGEFARINRRRRKNRQKLIYPLKPLYLVRVNEIGSHDGGREEGWKMPYQEIVHSHFQRYHTKEGLMRYFISPYRRGPENLPWKNPQDEEFWRLYMKGQSNLGLAKQTIAQHSQAFSSRMS